MAVGFVGFFVLVPVVAAVAIGLALAAARRSRQRNAQMAHYAAQRGWRYEPGRPGLPQRLGLEPDRGPFSSGVPARNVIEGVVDGWPVIAFDHGHYTGSGDDRRLARTGVVAVNLGVAVPELSLSSQGAVSRFFASLMGTDHVIGDRAFDDRVHIRTTSPQFAGDVLTPQLRTYLLARLHRDWRFLGDNLVTVTPGEHNPQEIEEALGSLTDVLGMIPAHVWQRLRFEPMDAPIADAPVGGPYGSAPAGAPQAAGTSQVAGPSQAAGTSQVAEAAQEAHPAQAAPISQPEVTPPASLESSIGWNIDPITGKRSSR